MEKKRGPLTCQSLVVKGQTTALPTHCTEAMGRATKAVQCCLRLRLRPGANRVI